MVNKTENELALELDDDDDRRDGEIVITAYEIRVKTSDIPEAGTDSNVFVEIVGDKARTRVQLTREIWLGWVVGNEFYKPEFNIKTMFEQKDKDVFLAYSTDVGNLLELRVIKDDAGSQSGWHLKWISITNKLTSQRKYFVCKNWIGANGRGPEVVLHAQNDLT